MKTLSYLLLLSVLISCNSDFEEVTVSYTKGTAIYGDLDAIRQTPLNGTSRAIEDAGKIFISNNLLLIGEENEGIHVLDNTDPENPVAQGFITIPGNKEYFVEGNIIYAESYYDMLKIDIADPLNPQLVARLENAITAPILNNLGDAVIAFEFQEVTEKVDKNGNVYDHLWNNSSELYFDFEQNLIPESAVPSSFAGNSNNQIGSINRIASLNGNLFVVSRSILSVYTTETFEQVFHGYMGWNMETVYPMGDKIFVGTNTSVEIFNVASPENPTYESSFWHADSCDPVLPVSQETAYTTLRTGEFVECPGDVNALIVLDISDPSFVWPQQEIEMESPYGLTMIDNTLYVGEGANGLKIFDATIEQNLVMTKWDQSVEAYDVLPHPTQNHILLITGPNGLGQYEIEQQELRLLSTISF